jgi:sulfur relay protein TusC/DsrF
MDFVEKKVLILITSKPFGKIIAAEGWRAAVGMFGMDHQSQMLFIGDGVYGIVKNQDIQPIRMFKSTFESFDGHMYASRKSLDERKITASEVFDEVEVLGEEEVAKRFIENEVIITF